MRKEYKIKEDLVGVRLDKALTELDDYSRTFIKENLDNKNILVNYKNEKPSYKMQAGDIITFDIPEEKKLDVEAKDMNLEIVYEDDDVAIINKPKGLVVHPANGHIDDTLVSGLMYQLSNLSTINGVKRPGIVHRIDKDTSGLLIIAKNDDAHNYLTEQLKDHSLRRKYVAIVCGIIEEERGRINAPIGRDPKDRKKMAVVKDGKRAVTQFKVLERFKRHTLIECELETGRTHQIRVHMQYIGKPILGDPLYGSRKIYGDLGQYLHAYELSFKHPRSEEIVDIKVDYPKYFEEELQKLREDK